MSNGNVSITQTYKEEKRNKLGYKKYIPSFGY
jgi:hypothetical protein